MLGDESCKALSADANAVPAADAEGICLLASPRSWQGSPESSSTKMLDSHRQVWYRFEGAASEEEHHNGGGEAAQQQG